jgi:hypothetical protein
VTSTQILDAVESCFYPKRKLEREWVFFRELRTGTGFEKSAMQRLDAWAMNMYRSNAWKRVSYEVKVSRADFIQEIKNPSKRKFGLMVSNEFYFAVPLGMVKDEEVPPECGLLEVGYGDDWRELLETKQLRGRVHWAAERGAGCFVVNRIPAPWRDCQPPSWSMVGALVRNLKSAVE